MFDMAVTSSSYIYRFLLKNVYILHILRTANSRAIILSHQLNTLGTSFSGVNGHSNRGFFILEFFLLELVLWLFRLAPISMENRIIRFCFAIYQSLLLALINLLFKHTVQLLHPLRELLINLLSLLKSARRCFLAILDFGHADEASVLRFFIFYWVILTVI